MKINTNVTDEQWNYILFQIVLQVFSIIWQFNFHILNSIIVIYKWISKKSEIILWYWMKYLMITLEISLPFIYQQSFNVDLLVKFDWSTSVFVWYYKIILIIYC